MTSSLRKAIRSAAAHGITQAVVVLDRDTGALLVTASPDAPFPSMSLVKLLIATDVLDRAGGADGLDAASASELWSMITLSDDDAASRLWVSDGGSALVDRVTSRLGITGIDPPSNPGMWGDTVITARAVADLLAGALADPAAGPWLVRAMRSVADRGADGFDQDFGMNTVDGAGSKQGWGCCLGGVRSLHSAGFTDRKIVVALSSAPPDIDYPTMRTALTDTVRAALG